MSANSALDKERTSTRRTRNAITAVAFNYSQIGSFMALPTSWEHPFRFCQAEADETIPLTLSNATDGAVIGGQDAVVLTILDEDQGTQTDEVRGAMLFPLRIFEVQNDCVEWGDRHTLIRYGILT